MKKDARAWYDATRKALTASSSSSEAEKRRRLRARRRVFRPWGDSRGERGQGGGTSPAGGGPAVTPGGPSPSPSATVGNGTAPIRETMFPGSTALPSAIGFSIDSSGGVPPVGTGVAGLGCGRCRGRCGG